MTKLANKTALVTGASRGLGKQLAIALAAQGANVVVNYSSRKEDADLTVAAIRQAGGLAIALQADVSQPAEVAKLFKETLTHYGQIDILINNAGVMTTKLLQDFTEAEFDAQFAINVKSVFLLMKAAATTLAERGRIINISSSTTRMIMPSYAIYAATKAAVEQMTKVFAKEVGHRQITVNTVLPGPMNTELFLKGKTPETIQRIASQSAFNRIGEVQDIVPTIMFLVSADAQWVTGQQIGVNGGMA